MRGLGLRLRFGNGKTNIAGLVLSTVLLMTDVAPRGWASPIISYKVEVPRKMSLLSINNKSASRHLETANGCTRTVNGGTRKNLLHIMYPEYSYSSRAYDSSLRSKRFSTGQVSEALFHSCKLLWWGRLNDVCCRRCDNFSTHSYLSTTLTTPTNEVCAELI